MESTVKKMDYFWNTFAGSMFIAVGTYFHVQSGIFLASIGDLKSGLEVTNTILSIFAYIGGLLTTGITIYKFIKDKKSN